MDESSRLVNPTLSRFLFPTKLYRELAILARLNETPETSQHALAECSQLSTTMVNNYIKRLSAENLIHVEGSTNRNMRYLLTEKGRKRLARLFLSYSVDIVRLYIANKSELKRRLQKLPESGIRRMVLFGAAETCEIVYAALKEMPTQVVGIVDNDSQKQGTRFFGIVVESPQVISMIRPDCVLITSFAKQDEIYDEIQHLEKELGIRVYRLSDL